MKNKAKTPKIKHSPRKRIIGIFLVVLVMAIGCGGLAFKEYIDWVDYSNANSINGISRASKVVSGDVKGAVDCKNWKTREIFKSLSGQKKWFLLGDHFSQDQTLELDLIIQAQDVEFINQFDPALQYQIVGLEGHRVEGSFLNSPTNANKYLANIDTSDLPVDEYSVRAIVDYGCGQIKSESYQFFVSHPVYVTWTIDWEGSDVPQENLESMDELTSKHRNFPLTHFFNPRIYIWEGISGDRAQYLTNWVKFRRDKYGHAIGLHLHMFPDMVKAAGVEPQTSPAWGWYRDDGYDILVSGYSYEDMNIILDWSQQQFLQNGLGDPDMFRAGGWFADEGTLQVLEDNGFVLDSSGRDKYSIGSNDVETHWNLSTTTQPYRPNKYDQNSREAPNMDIWEFPNNGGSAFSIDENELYQAFSDNYSGKVLGQPKVVTYLSHPDWFEVDKPRMDKTLTRIEENMYEDDNGPVIYTTLKYVYNIWDK